MNILIINHYAGSNNHGMEYRHYYLAKEWIKFGHKVSIIGSSFSHLRDNIKIEKSYCKLETIDSIDYYWLKTNKYYGNGVLRVLNIFCFCYNLFRLRHIVSKKIKPDIILVSSPHALSIFQIVVLSKKNNSRVIFEVRDLWPLTLLELGKINKYNPFVVVSQFAENFAYKNCDLTVSLIPGAVSYMMNHGLEYKKFMYIPNGVDVATCNLVSTVATDNIVSNKLIELKKNGYFIVGYVGTIGVANCLETLINTKNFLTGCNNKVAVIIIGDGNQKIKLEQIVKKESIKDVYFFGRLQKNTISVLLNYFDSFYIGLHKLKLFELGVSPNKIFDYMMSGKPIINAIDTEFDIIKLANCGISVEAENSKAVAEAIIKLKNMTVEERKQLGENGKKYVIEHHDYKILAKKYLDIMEKLVDRK